LKSTCKKNVALAQFKYYVYQNRENNLIKAITTKKLLNQNDAIL